jgi:Tol biopolymer transport system component
MAFKRTCRLPAILGIALLVPALAGGARPAAAQTYTQFTSINLGGDNSPAWSADGLTIYYSSRASGFPYIYFKAANAPASSPGTRLTTLQVDELAVSISGDNAWAVLCVRDSLSSAHLWRCPSTGGAPLSQMTYGPFEDLHPDWWGSGASQEVAFATTRGGAGYQIWTLRPNGTLPVTQYTAVTGPGFTDLDPVFSPDGSRIAFSSDRAGVRQIFVSTRTAGGWTAPAQITTGTGDKGRPSWSPGGSAIAYQVTSGGRNPDTSLWVMNADGSNARLVTGTGTYDAEPCFSPLGAQLAFVSDRSGAQYIWLLNGATTPARPATMGQVKDAYRR